VHTNLYQWNAGALGPVIRSLTTYLSLEYIKTIQKKPDHLPQHPKGEVLPETTCIALAVAVANRRNITARGSLLLVVLLLTTLVFLFCSTAFIVRSFATGRSRSVFISFFTTAFSIPLKLPPSFSSFSSWALNWHQRNESYEQRLCT
jgi:hypothetical protein